jgi:hypothetical protein
VPADPIHRQAARTATMFAVPVALAVVGISIWVYGRGEASPTVAPSVGTQATAPVEMAAPALTEDVAAACRTVVAHLPDTIRDHKRRPVTAGSEQNAAYGDPAITFSCGISAPSLAPTTMVYSAGGVCWAAVPASSGTITGTEWTTVDRTITQRVFVPGPSDGSGQTVVPFAEPIADAVTRLATAPSGCG